MARTERPIVLATSPTDEVVDVAQHQHSRCNGVSPLQRVERDSASVTSASRSTRRRDRRSTRARACGPRGCGVGGGRWPDGTGITDYQVTSAEWANLDPTAQTSAAREFCLFTRLAKEIEERVDMSGN